MNYLSVCSGVEAATVAWNHMGWKPVGFSEIEKFPSQVLSHHYPTVTNFGDMTKYKEWKINDPIGLLVGGTPCQSFSVAGLRKGMDDPRGNLALVYCGILNHYRPKWFVWENVPGVLSSNRGRDFGSFLGAVAELGYGFAYRVLDAQYWGVAQRRKRVFVVGYLGDWRPAAAVLFEPKSVSRDTAPSRKEGENPAAFTASSFGNYSKGVGKIRAAGGDLGGGSETLYVPNIANCLQTTCDDYSRADGFNMIATGAFGKEIADTVTAKFSKGAELLQQGARNGGNCVLQPITSNNNANNNNAPLVQAFRKSRRAQSADDFETWVDDGKANTINTFDLGDIRTTHAVATAFGWQNSTSQSMSVDIINPTLDKSKTPAVAYGIPGNWIGRKPENGGNATTPMDDVAPCLTKTDMHGVAYSFDSLASNSMKSSNPLSGCREVDLSKTIDTTYPCPSKNQGGIGIMQSMAVRRLTPVECERLQGFPDNYTNIKENCPDGPRYKAMGNSMAVPVMRWIGERINRVNNEQ